MPPGQLEEPVEGPPVGLPFLSAQPGHGLLTLHMLLPGPARQPSPQEPLPQQEPLPRPSLPAQRGRSDRGRGDQRGHWHQSEPRRQRGPLGGVGVHKTQPAANVPAAVGAARGHGPLPLAGYSRKPLQGSHSGPDSKQPHQQRSLWLSVGLPSPERQRDHKCRCVPERCFHQPVGHLQHDERGHRRGGQVGGRGRRPRVLHLNLQWQTLGLHTPMDFRLYSAPWCLKKILK